MKKTSTPRTRKHRAKLAGDGKVRMEHRMHPEVRGEFHRAAEAINERHETFVAEYEDKSDEN